MFLSEKKEYIIAVVAGESVLTVAALRNKIAGVQAGLRAKRVMPGDKAVVFVSSEAHLVAATWALLGSSITCVPVNPADGTVDPVEIARRCQATCIITEQQYADRMPSANVMVMDEGAGATPASAEEAHCHAGESAVPFLFYEHPDRDGAAQTVTAQALRNVLDVLDGAVPPARHKRMLLSRCIPFSRLVIELLWASSRGVSVAVDSLDGDASLRRYTAREDEFCMKFSLFYFGSYNPSADQNKYALLFDSIRFADKHNFSAVWTPERHFNEFGGLYPNPSLLSAAIAVSTTHVQIRSGSLVSPLHHPVRIAEDWAVVDNLSNGRVGISFASGWQCDDFIFAPENYPGRHACMMEQIDVVRTLWKGEKVAFKNGLGKETDIAIFPKPVQPELPVWITVSGKTETFEDAGKIGANILTHLLWQDTDELIDKIAAYRRALAESGYDPRSRTVTVMVHTFLGDDNETVRSKVREPLKNYIRSSTQLIQAMVKSNVGAANSKEVGGRYGTVSGEIPEHLMDELLEIAFNRFFDHAGLLGTVEKARKMLKRLKGYDVDEVASLIDFGLSGEDIMNGLTYLNELRSLYDEEKAVNFPATVTHVSLATAENARYRPDLLAYFESQKLVLVEANSFAGIPQTLLQNARTICNDHPAGQPVHCCIEEYQVSNVEIEALFSAAIDEDF